MNIFFLHRNPVQAARMHCDKHVIKMILESAQLLSSAHWVLDGEYQDGRWFHPDKDIEELLYRPTHLKHPCAIWVRESTDNYTWLYNLFIALSDEFNYRYDRFKPHKSVERLGSILLTTPNNMDWRNEWTEPPQAMPKEYRGPDSVEAYRRYYINDKAAFATWKKREKPDWFLEKKDV